MSLYLEEPQASIDAVQTVATVASILGMALLANVRQTLATNWSLAAVTECGCAVAFARRFHLTVDSFSKMSRC